MVATACAEQRRRGVARCGVLRTCGAVLNGSFPSQSVFVTPGAYEMKRVRVRARERECVYKTGGGSKVIKGSVAAGLVNMHRGGCTQPELVDRAQFPIGASCTLFSLAGGRAG